MVNWKVSTDVLPADLQKTLEEFTNERWRVLTVNNSADKFTVVGYRMTRNERHPNDDLE